MERTAERRRRRPSWTDRSTVHSETTKTFGIGLDGAQVNKFVKVVSALYDAYLATDASLLEINPLVVTASGDLLALDAKMNFDDNSLYRHPVTSIRRCHSCGS